MFALGRHVGLLCSNALDIPGACTDMNPEVRAETDKPVRRDMHTDARLAHEVQS